MKQVERGGQVSGGRSWPELVSLLESSGEPLSAFALRMGVRPATLGWWRWRLRQREEGDRVAFAQVVVSEPADLSARGRMVDEVSSVEFALPTGVVVRLSGGVSLVGVARLAAMLGAP